MDRRPWSRQLQGVSWNVGGGRSREPHRFPVSPVLPFQNTSLTNGITYFYKVAAVNTTGTGGASNEASAKPTGVAGLPAPTGLNAIPGDKQVRLSWAAVSGPRDRL